MSNPETSTCAPEDVKPSTLLSASTELQRRDAWPVWKRPPPELLPLDAIAVLFVIFERVARSTPKLEMPPPLAFCPVERASRTLRQR